MNEGTNTIHYRLTFGYQSKTVLCIELFSFIGIVCLYESSATDSGCVATCRLPFAFVCFQLVVWPFAATVDRLFCPLEKPPFLIILVCSFVPLLFAILQLTSVCIRTCPRQRKSLTHTCSVDLHLCGCSF